MNDLVRFPAYQNRPGAFLARLRWVTGHQQSPWDIAIKELLRRYIRGEIEWFEFEKKLMRWLADI